MTDERYEPIAPQVQHVRDVIAADLLEWVDRYGDPEDWAKRAQNAHARAERAEAEVQRLQEAWRWLAWLDGDRRDDGTRSMEGTPYQAAQRVARRLYEADIAIGRLREALESVCNVGDRAAVMVAREALNA
jgi:hypothetical protein